MAEKKSIKGRLLIIIGAVLLLSALSLVFYNNYRQKASNDEMLTILSQVSDKIPQIEQPDNSNQSSSDNSHLIVNPDDFSGDNSLQPEQNDNSNIEEPYIEVEQRQYIGILNIPSVGLEFPVMSDWTYDDLYDSPCRYSGSVATSDIIIAAHNYRYFFGPIDNLNSGDKLIFTAADGKVYTYSVITSEIINGDDANSLRDNSDEWDMTLFTCTWTGTSRLVVRAILDE